MTTFSKLSRLLVLLWCTFGASYSFSVPPSTEEQKILALGDSLTFGYEVDQKNSWPSLLSKKLGIPVVNGGTAGATSAFGVSTLRFHLKRYKPSLVIYALGANDGLRGIKTEVTKANIKKAVEMCQKKGIKVVLLGMRAPPNYGKKFPKKFASIYPEVASELKVPLMPFFLEGIAGKPEFNQPDGIHPNDKGYQIMAQNIFNFIKKHYDVGNNFRVK